MIAAAFAVHARILTAVFQRPLGGEIVSVRQKLTTLLILVAIATLVMGYFIGGTPGAYKVALVAVLVVGIIILWMVQGNFFMQLNHPVHARLMPRQLRVLRQSMLVSWLVCAIAGGLVLAVAVGFQHMLSSTVGLALAMVVLLMALAWPLRWAACILPVFAGTGMLAAFLSTPWRALAPHWKLVLQGLGGLLLLVLCALVLTRGILQSGSAKHARSYERGRRIRVAVAATDSLGTASLFAHERDWIQATVRFLKRPYWAYARALLRSPRATPGHAVARAEMVLGAGISWVAQVQVACIALLTAAIILAVGRYLHGVWDLGWWSQLGRMPFFLSFWLVYLGVLPVLGLAHAMARTRREQALLLLLPGMPQGADLGRQLLGRLLRRALLGWLLAFGLMLLLPFQPGDQVLVLAGYLAVLPLLPGVLCDWSRLRQSQGSLGPMVWLLGAALGALLCFDLLSWLQWPLPVVVVLSLLCFAVHLGWRWKRLAKLPCIFPAGRLA